MFDTTRQDLRYAWRHWMQKPAFTVAAVAVLGLGIGATTALFSVLHAVVIEPLPFHQPERLARLHHLSDEWGQVPSTMAHVVAFTEQAESLDAVATYRRRPATLIGRAGPEQLDGFVTAGPFFDVLGAPLSVGRGLTELDHDPASPPVIVLGHAASRRLLDVTREPVGQTVRVDGHVRTVIGVARPGFALSEQEVDFWLPSQRVDRESTASVQSVVVRLADGMTIDRAAEELTLISRRMLAADPEAGLGDVTLQPLLDAVIAPVKQPITWLMGVVVLVLLIACANVSNLLLARALGRRREMAVRRALGAGRLRMVRQLLTESLVLAMLGGVVGLLIAGLSLEGLLALYGDQVPRGREVAFDGVALAFAVGLSCAASLLFGVVPSVLLAGSGNHPWTGWRDGGRTSRGGRPQRVLAIVQTALAVVLLVGAGLLVRSLDAALDIDPGFRTEDGLSFTISPARSRYAEPGALLRFHERLQTRFEHVPGVDAVTRATFLPLNRRTGWATSIHIAGRPDSEGVFLYRMVDPEYFSVIGARHLDGRPLTVADGRDRRSVVMINETMARRLWPRGDAIGASITLGHPEDPLIEAATVVGVVADARDIDLVEAPRPVLYAPHHLVPAFGRFRYVVRSSVAPDGLLPDLRRALHAMDPEVALYDARTLDGLVADNVAGTRAFATLSGAFALLALVLAAIGLFSLTAYRVAQRSQELAIRMTFGATTSDIRRLVVGEGLTLAGIGLAVGLTGAFGLGRFLDSLLFGVTAYDPTTLVVVALVLLAVMAGASLLPARRAARIEPVALLQES